MSMENQPTPSASQGVLVNGVPIDLVTAKPSMRSRWHSFKNTRGFKLLKTLFLPLLFILWKLKSLVLLLPKIKFLGTMITMVVSIGAYTLFWGLPFAVGFILLLFIHEMGHVIQLRREGIKATAPMFIPFLGAVVAMKELPKDASMEARVGLAGPVLGLIGTVLPLGLWLLTDNQMFLALVYFNLFLQLFNLIPISPLDGGRAMVALSPYLLLVGCVGIGLLFLVTPSPFLILIAVLGGLDSFSRIYHYHRSDDKDREYYRVPVRTKVLIASVYLSIVAISAIGMMAAYIDPNTLS